MSFIEQLFAESLGIALFFLCLFLICIWALIRSAVKSGTKAALNEFFNETFRTEEIQAQREKEFKEEMDSWN